MNILFITNCYYPDGDATSVVVHNLAKALLKKNCSIHVLVLTSEEELATTSEKDGVHITNLLVSEMGGLESIINRISIWKPKTIQVFLKKTYSVLRFKYSYAYHRYYELPAKLKGFIRGIKKITSEEMIDLIIPTLMPSEAGHALICLNDRTIPFALYQLDTYWNNATLPPKYSSDRFDLERRINEKAIFNITTPQIIEKNQEKYRRITRVWSAPEQVIREGRDYCGFLCFF